MRADSSKEQEQQDLVCTSNACRSPAARGSTMLPRCSAGASRRPCRQVQRLLDQPERARPTAPSRVEPAATWNARGARHELRRLEQRAYQDR